jgi:hypothetical protein
LDWTNYVNLEVGNIYYNPFHMISIFFLLGSVLILAIHGATIVATSKWGAEREIDEMVMEGSRNSSGAIVLALDDGIQRKFIQHSLVGMVVCSTVWDYRINRHPDQWYACRQLVCMGSTRTHCRANVHRRLVAVYLQEVSASAHYSP